MAGLDKIISQIKEESQKAAERTRAEARSKADEILAQARADAERECVDIERRSKQAVANILERGPAKASSCSQRRTWNACPKALRTG